MPSVLWTSSKSHSLHGKWLRVGSPSAHVIDLFRRHMSLVFLLVAGLFMLRIPGSQIWTQGPYRQLGLARRSCRGLLYGLNHWEISVERCWFEVRSNSPQVQIYTFL